MSGTKTLRWPGIPEDGVYGMGVLRGNRATPGDCLAQISEPPYYIHYRQCSRKASVDGLCRQHAKQRDRWLKAMGG